MLIVLSIHFYASLFELREMLNYQSRKRTAGEIDGVISNGTHSNKLKTHKVNQMENRHSESLYHSSEAVVALAARNPMTANASVNHKVKLFSYLCWSEF